MEKLKKERDLREELRALDMRNRRLLVKTEALRRERQELELRRAQLWDALLALCLRPVKECLARRRQARSRRQPPGAVKAARPAVMLARRQAPAEPPEPRAPARRRLERPVRLAPEELGCSARARLI